MLVAAFWHAVQMTFRRKCEGLDCGVCGHCEWHHDKGGVCFACPAGRFGPAWHRFPS